MQVAAQPALALLATVLLASLTAHSADAASAPDTAGSLVATPPAARAFEPGRVRLLDGPFKTIQELHRTGLVGQLDPDRLLYNFRKLAGLPQPRNRLLWT